LEHALPTASRCTKLLDLKRASGDTAALLVTDKAAVTPDCRSSSRAAATVAPTNPSAFRKIRRVRRRRRLCCQGRDGATPPAGLDAPSLAQEAEQQIDAL
jgi:hypothetical protein